ncbi:MAG: DoxX family protein [Thermoplasmata archaeon]|nr:DoxX family protein [Thermoplasmata archaeon]
MASESETPKSLWARYASSIKTLFRVLFGAVWLLAGYFKFVPGFAANFTVANGSTQPVWLQGWFGWWAGIVNPNPVPWVYLVGTLEVLIGLALIFGFMRKLAYVGAGLLALFIWAVPEGFGGPYGGGTNTDIGTGFVYSMLAVSLLIINGVYGPSRWSLDYYIERYWPKWAKLAEVNAKAVTPNVPPAATSEPARSAA